MSISHVGDPGHPSLGSYGAYKQKQRYKKEGRRPIKPTQQIAGFLHVVPEVIKKKAHSSQSYGSGAGKTTGVGIQRIGKEQHHHQQKQQYGGKPRDQLLYRDELCGLLIVAENIGEIE